MRANRKTSRALFTASDVFWALFLIGIVVALCLVGERQIEQATKPTTPPSVHASTR